MRPLLLSAALLCLATAAYAQGYPWCTSMDEVSVEVDASNITFHHDKATYNCCPDSFEYEVTVSNGTLYVVEHEVLTNPCACLCCYGLSTTVENLPPGSLHVVFRWLDDDPGGWRDWPLDVTIGDSGQAGQIAEGPSYHSDCVNEVSTQSLQWGVLKSWYE